MAITFRRFIKPKTVARELDITYRKTLELIRCGVLPAYKIGGEYRIERAELEGFIRSHKSQRK